MSNTFKKNDRVIVVSECKRYNKRFNRSSGTVLKQNASSDMIGVIIDGMHNDNSAYGCFWFEPNDLQLVKFTSDYAEPDIDNFKKFINSIYGLPSMDLSKEIKKVHFSGPVTVVIWEDGTKTLVKCSKDDFFDYEKGLAIAIVKKMYGNDNSFHKIFKKWIPKESEITSDTPIQAISALFDLFR